MLTDGKGAALKTIVVITDYLGRAKLPPTGLPAGTYKLTASFAGNATYAAATTAAQDLAIATQTITFGGGLPGVLPVSRGLRHVHGNEFVRLAGHRDAGARIRARSARSYGRRHAVHADRDGRGHLHGQRVGGGHGDISRTSRSPRTSRSRRRRRSRSARSPTRRTATRTSRSARPRRAASRSRSRRRRPRSARSAAARCTSSPPARPARSPRTRPATTQYFAAPTVTQSFTVNKAAQVHHVRRRRRRHPPSYGSSFPVSATASSSQPVTIVACRASARSPAARSR